MLERKLKKHLHSCLVHEFHQQRHGSHHSSYDLPAASSVKYHWYKKVDGYFFLSFPLIELCNQPTRKIIVVWKLEKNFPKQLSFDIDMKGYEDVRMIKAYCFTKILASFGRDSLRNCHS